MFSCVVIVGFLRSVLFGFGVVVEAENPRGIRCFVLLLESLPCVYRNSNFVAFMCRKFSVFRFSLSSDCDALVLSDFRVCIRACRRFAPRLFLAEVWGLGP